MVGIIMEHDGISIDVSVEDSRWQDVDSKLTDRFIEYGRTTILVGFPQLPAAELSVVLTDDLRIRTLNGTYRGKDRPTNVLSFGHLDQRRQLRPMGMGQPYPLGDIVLSYDTIAFEAKTQNKPMVHHVAHLFIHGVLHLLGYTHDGERDANQMEDMEIRILHTFHIPNPYDTLSYHHDQLPAEEPLV